MKHLFYIILTALIPIFPSCSGSGQIASDYDGNLCRDLSVKIENRDSLSQSDYAEMIAQNKAILQYLVNSTKEISELPDSIRNHRWRLLTATPEYLEKFGYMFTIGSSLYRADNAGLLDKKNAKEYHDLDRYNEDLAKYSERY